MTSILVAAPSQELVAFDLETHVMCPTAVLPRMVCLTRAWREHDDLETDLVSNGDPDLLAVIEGMLDDAIAGKIRLVGHNVGGFDLPDIFVNYPHLISKIFRVLELGRVHDTLVREKLLNLADHGQIDDLFLPDGSSRKIRYGLGDLVAKYLGFDRTSVKDKDAEDRWQLNFGSLDGVPSSSFPSDAADYARTDSADALLVFEAQERLAAEKFRGAIGHDGKPFDVFRTEPLHVGAMFCLALMTATGFRIDQAEVARMRARVEAELTPERARILVDAGLLTPAQPPRPYKNGARDADGTPKMVPAEPEHLNAKALRALVERTCLENKVSVRRTDPSSKFPEGQISADAEVISDLARFSPVLAEYEHRQGLQKLVTLEIPKLETFLVDGRPESERIVVQTIHPNYDFLKRTGRTSSFAGKWYPSINVQQVPRAFDLEDGTKIEPRNCYLPRTEGWVLFTVDFAFIELATAAQICFNTFGQSVLRDKINAGYDVHGYLGAQLAYEIENDFYQCCKDVLGNACDRDGIYKVFASLKSGSKEEREFHSKYRNFAKPTGLGFFGGLSHETLLSYAKSTYGIIIPSVEMGKRFKEIWKEVIPEGPAWLDYISEKCIDTVNTVDQDHPVYAGFSPLGMWRAGMNWCAAANSGALQTPTGEGAKISIINVSRACYDSTLDSCLYGMHPLAWVHDEFILEGPEDEFMHERASEISRIMIESMGVICPDVKISVEAAIARRWSKRAKPVFKDDRLQVWEAK